MRGKSIGIAITIFAVIFTISYATDTTPPEITNVKATPAEAWQGEEIEISCTVVDNVEVNVVKVVIKYPDNSTVNMTMKKSGNKYYYRDTYEVVGTYIYHIWANDTSGNANVSANYTFIVRKDTIPPMTYCILYGEEGENNWYISNVTVKLFAEDVGVGVKSIYYKLNSNPWLEYITPFVVSEEGFHNIFYYSEDKVGNEEKIKHREFKIDKTPPHTICNLSGELGCNQWYITNVTITLIANDEISGINKTFYKIDDGYWTEYTEPFIVSEDGIHTVYYYSINKAGLEEKERTKTFKIDKINPQARIIKPREGYLYIEDREIMPTITGKTVIIGRITIEVNATNHESGINRVEFYIDNEYQTEDKEEPYQWTWDYVSLGTHLIKVIAVDNAGNTGSDEITVWILNI